MQTPEEETPALSFKVKAKNYIKTLPKRYFITAFSGMAQGLFVTLIAGTILAQIAGWIGGNYVGNTLSYIAALAKTLMGAGIGVGIAHALGKHKLLVFSAAVAGMVGAFADKLFVGSQPFVSVALGAPGNPIGAYVVTMLVVEIAGLYAGRTKLDILLVPLGALSLAFIGVFAAYPFIWLVDGLGKTRRDRDGRYAARNGYRHRGRNGRALDPAYLLRGDLGGGSLARTQKLRRRFGGIRGDVACGRRGDGRLRLSDDRVRGGELSRK